jgi:hypothetical protein
MIGLLFLCTVAALLELGVLSYDVDSLTVVLLSNALVSDSARSCKKQAQIASPKVPQL